MIVRLVDTSVGIVSVNDNCKIKKIEYIDDFMSMIFDHTKFLSKNEMFSINLFSCIVTHAPRRC